MDSVSLGGGADVAASSEGFMQVLARREDADLINVARRIMEWTQERGLPLRWGMAGGVPVFVPEIAGGERTYRFVEITSKGRVDLLLDVMMQHEPFSDEEMRLEILRRLNRITGMGLPDFTASRRPNFSLAALASDEAFDNFADTFAWVISMYE